MANDDWKEKITEYLRAAGPKLLSSVGEQFTGCERPEGKLKLILESNGIHVRDVGGGRFYAYLDEQEGDMASLGEAAPPVSAYKRALLLAFCRRLEEGASMGFNPVDGKYVVLRGDDELEDGVLPVEEEFRHPGLDIDNLSEENRAELLASIKDWCNKHNVSRFTLIKAGTAPASPVHPGVGRLLRLFLDAQPRDIRDRVNLPGALLEQLLQLSR